MAACGVCQEERHQELSVKKNGVAGRKSEVVSMAAWRRGNGVLNK